MVEHQAGQKSFSQMTAYHHKTVHRKQDVREPAEGISRLFLCAMVEKEKSPREGTAYTEQMMIGVVKAGGVINECRRSKRNEKQGRKV